MHSCTCTVYLLNIGLNLWDQTVHSPLFFHVISEVDCLLKLLPVWFFMASGNWGECKNTTGTGYSLPFHRVFLHSPQFLLTHEIPFEKVQRELVMELNWLHRKTGDCEPSSARWITKCHNHWGHSHDYLRLFINFFSVLVFLVSCIIFKLQFLLLCRVIFSKEAPAQ